MENASKALIIAGAILLSILIIGVGIAVFNSVSAPAAGAGETMDQYAIQMYNSRFEQYAGNQTGSNVKSLITAVIANNNEATAQGYARVITINTAAPTGTLLNNVQAAGRYTVTMNAYLNDGNRLLSDITIAGPGIVAAP